MTRKASAIALAAALLSSGALAQEQDQRASFGDDASYNYFGGVSVGYKYQELEADTIRDAYVKTVGLNILQFEWFPEQATWMQNISWMAAIRPRLSYELTPGDSADQDEIAQASDSEKEGWTRFVADLSIDPIQLFGGEKSNHRIDINYDVQTFLITVQATRDYFYIEDNDAKLLTAGDKIDVNTTFTEAVIGYAVEEEDLRLMVGFFSVDYEKPVSSDVSTPIESIYKGNFESRGIYMGGSIRLFGNLDLSLRYDYSYDAEATVDGGTSLTRDEFGIEDSIEYDAYTLNAVYDLRKTTMKLPMEVRFSYIQRQFDALVEGSTVNDDRIFGVSLIGSFTL
ncbi:hypothetical protein [Spongiibacter marinus]|uniref:hypothetical protein n=1 Tax=Spongiibacter marinus TaxID=354246 RepID=UPI00195FBEF5|nr:hypothetical protein [Spongiibacter marinus]MBM7421844.1 opacity protein-like surface antigen [Spongiibacter marinus]